MFSYVSEHDFKGVQKLREAAELSLTSSPALGLALAGQPLKPSPHPKQTSSETQLSSRPQATHPSAQA